MILHLRSDATIASLFEERVCVVVARIVVAEVVVPVALFDTVVHMNFAEDGNFVSGLLEQVGEEGDVGRERSFEVLVGESSGRARVHAGERRGAGGSAESVSAEGVVEEHSLLPDAVVIWSLEDGVTGEGESIGALTLTKKVDDVWALRLCLRCGWRCRNSCCRKSAGYSQCSLKEVTPCCFIGCRDRRDFRNFGDRPSTFGTLFQMSQETG